MTLYYLIFFILILIYFDLTYDFYLLTSCIILYNEVFFILYTPIDISDVNLLSIF